MLNVFLKLNKVEMKCFLLSLTETFESMLSFQRSKQITFGKWLHDGRGNTLSALYVFSESIKYFKNHFITSSRVASLNIKDEDIHWVLTVPAIWSDCAKQFMREAAKMVCYKIFDNSFTIS